MLTRKKRYVVILAAVLCLSATQVTAAVPQETLERLADIRVSLVELNHLSKINKVTGAEYNVRRTALENESRAVWDPYKQVSRDDYATAQSTINGLVSAKLAVLVPQWQREENEYRQTTQQQHKQNGIALEADARRAAEFQRQRILLQQQLDQGTIDHNTFTLKDKTALDAIASLRKKYEGPNRSFEESVQRFDQRVAQLTKAIADNPNAELPHSQVSASENGRGGPYSYDSDVNLAASILIKQTENHFRFDKQQITSAAFTQTDIVYDHDLARLRARYQAISSERARAFQSAYTNRAAEQVQALRVKYFPDKYVVPAANGSQRPAASSSGIGTAFWYVGLALVIGFFLWLIGRHKTQPVDPAPPLSDNYGTADWADYQRKPPHPAAVLDGVMFGKCSRPGLRPDTPGAPITSVPEAHTLIVARTRAGKGTRVIVPTLLRYRDSMLVIDPKGENAAITARVRRDQLGHAVHIVNPWGEMKALYDRLGFPPATFNPLDAIERDDPNAVAVAQTLAATICPTGNDKDKFWQGSAANVLAAVFLWLADRAGEQKTLARARELVTMSRKDFTEVLVKMASSEAYAGAIKELVSQYIDLAPETYSGIMSNLAESTKFLSDPRIKAATAASSFSLGTLRDVYATVYLVIPHDRIQTHATWLRLVIAAAMQGIKGRNALAAPPHHRCMFLIDEFGSIGHIADIPRDIALMSGYGLDFTLIVQGFDQLKDHYGDAKGTILSNCGYKWFCYVNELETAKYLSESLGKATVRTIGKSKSFGTAGGGAATEGESTTYGETGRALLTPDEILNLGRDTAILLHPFGLPYYLRPVDYWKLTETFAHLKEEYTQLYWDPPLAYDPNPYAPQSGGGEMSRSEALDILSLGEDADNDAITTRYLLMVKHLQSGEDDVARKINTARAVLLGE